MSETIKVHGLNKVVGAHCEDETPSTAAVQNDCNTKDGATINPAKNVNTDSNNEQGSNQSALEFSPCPADEISLAERIERAADFLSSWYEGAGDFYSSLFKVEGATAFPFQCGSKEQIIDALNRFAKYEAIRAAEFFHVNVTRSVETSQRRLKTATVDAQMGICIDIDFDDAGHKGDTSNHCPNLETAREALSRVPLKPSYVVFTGHGCHVYYKFSEPIVFDGDSARSEAKARSERFTKFFSDKFGFPADACHDLTRILRVPYTYNFKDGKKILSYVAYSSNARYTPQMFDELIAQDNENLFSQSHNGGENFSRENEPAEIDSVPPVETKIPTPIAKGKYVETGDLTGCAIEILHLLNPSKVCDIGGDVAWLSVMTACKQLGVSYSEVDSWNAQDSARYNSKVNKIRWDSLQPNPNYGLGTLLGQADKQGISVNVICDIKEKFGVEISRADVRTDEKKSVEASEENSASDDSDDPTAEFASISVRQKFLEALINYEINSRMPLWLYKSYWYTNREIITDLSPTDMSPILAVDRLNMGEFICAVYEDIARRIERTVMTPENFLETKSSVAELPSFVEEIALAALFKIDERTVNIANQLAKKFLTDYQYKEWVSLVKDKKYQFLKRLNENIAQSISDSQEKVTRRKDVNFKLPEITDVGFARKFNEIFGKNIRYTDAVNELLLFDEELFRRAGQDVFSKTNSAGILRLFQPRWRRLTPKKEYSSLYHYFIAFLEDMQKYYEEKLGDVEIEYCSWLNTFWDAHKDSIVPAYIAAQRKIKTSRFGTVTNTKTVEELAIEIEHIFFRTDLRLIATNKEVRDDFEGNFLPFCTEQNRSDYRLIVETYQIYRGCIEIVKNRKETRSMNAALAVSFSYLTLEDKKMVDGTSSFIGCLNGVLDLKTGKMLDYDAISSSLVTKHVNAIYQPNFRADVVEHFFETTFPDEETRAAVKRWLGYLLTGEVIEQKALFFDGRGANGKSTLLTILAKMMNFDDDGYSTRLPSSMLLKSNFVRDPNAPSPEKDKLRGRRLAIIDEMTGAPIDEAEFKSMVGGDILEGRDLHKSTVTFTPSHKLVIAGNSIPAMNVNLDVTYSNFVSDNPIGRRIAIVPFKQFFSGRSRNVNLVDELSTPAAMSGLFSMLVDEARAWYDAYDHGRERIKNSAEMDDALHGYYEKCINAASEKARSREEAQTPALLDEIIDFANEYCIITGDAKDSVSFKTFKTRFEEGAMFGSSDKLFNRAIRRYVETTNQLSIIRTKSGNVIRGIKLSCAVEE